MRRIICIILAFNDGNLHVVLPIGSIAGADSYEQVLSLDDIGE